MTDPNDQFPLYQEPFDVMTYITDHSFDLITAILIVVAVSMLYYLATDEDK